MDLFQVLYPGEVSNIAIAPICRYLIVFMQLILLYCTELSAIVNIKLMDPSNLLSVKAS